MWKLIDLGLLEKNDFTLSLKLTNASNFTFYILSGLQKGFWFYVKSWYRQGRRTANWHNKNPMPKSVAATEL